MIHAYEKTLSFCWFSVADKILKKKTFPLYMNPKCYQVTVSPFIERRLEKYQVQLPLFLPGDISLLRHYTQRPWDDELRLRHSASQGGLSKRSLHCTFAWSVQNEFVFLTIQSCAFFKKPVPGLVVQSWNPSHSGGWGGRFSSSMLSLATDFRGNPGNLKNLSQNKKSKNKGTGCNDYAWEGPWWVRAQRPHGGPDRDNYAVHTELM